MFYLWILQTPVGISSRSYQLRSLRSLRDTPLRSAKMRKEIKAYRNLRAAAFFLLFLTSLITLTSALICTAPTPIEVFENESKKSIGRVFMPHDYDLSPLIMLVSFLVLQIWALLHFGKRMKKLEEMIGSTSQSKADQDGVINSESLRSST